MAIHNIPNLTINGSKTAYGGYPYSLSFDQGIRGEPSQMTISLVSANGKFSEPDVGYDKKINVGIGGISFTMYIHTFKIIESSAGNVLEINCEDPLSKLNQYFVGLFKRHGIESLGCLIIVGEEKGLAEDGVTEIKETCLSGKDSNTETVIDISDLEATTILDVDYKFSDLIKGMRGAGIDVSGGVDKNEDYRARHIGKLKDVLDSWCGEFGYSYFFDQKRQQIVFIDVSEGISINFGEPAADSVLEKTKSKTVKGTSGKSSISYFGADGQIRCLVNNGNKGFLSDFIRVLNCSPITIDQVFPNGHAGVGAEHLGIAASLSKYSETLRNAYFLYTVRNVQSIMGGSNLSIPEYGNMTILRAFSNASLDVDKQIFDACYDNLQSKPVDKSNLCFWYADMDDTTLQQQYSWESSVGSSFLGRYWIADYGVTNIKTKPGPPEIISDGEAIYFDSKNPGSAPIFIDVGGFSYEFSPGLTRFILADRSPAWFPSDVDISVQEQAWSKHIPAETSSITDQTVTLLQQLGVPITDTSKMYYVIYPPASPNVSTGGGGPHPNEQDPQSLESNGASYPYGIINKQTTSIDFDGYKIYMPVGALGAAYDQYKILVKDAVGLLNTCKTLNKVETFFSKVDCSKDLENLDISFLDISTLDLELYNYDEKEDTCIPDLEKIKEAHEKFNDNLNYATPKKFEERSYVVAGVPSDIPSVSGGLIALNITVDENGVKTKITVGNTAAQPPSLDYSLAKAQFSKNDSTNRYNKTLNYHGVEIDRS